jgi:hypothetical protein
LGDSFPPEIETISSELIAPKQTQVYFSYIPQVFQQDVLLYTKTSRQFLDAPSIQEKIHILQVEFYKKLVDVRGKMKHETIKMWGLEKLSQAEFLSVFIHEFSHYIDIYYFSPGVFGDMSTRFYSFSWQDTTILKE